MSKEKILESLKSIEDPEIGLDIVTLGLIYEVEIQSKDHVHLLITFTSPMCPFGPQLIGQIEDKVRELGYRYPEVEVTFDPPWSAPEDLREIMGFVI
ncbi:MAG: aromatic ring hydroxylase [Candidatus Magasanikbacteria bacterium CG11_big_fil_rev_8_21_14_0_20_39_34]|uniref:Aromatic ring hydroxylase n=1 Tax=Candidatus Magasanikbacteria bacterium CG11_big_fil_rev_8_21_14_0_20_39_34 TaxID=1974653 RepID=A0A2H0N5D5_9BACT|nr:MAG: aromatic ring hydroxylase [Candidatus Magasanikbacteria bacterium CG11_big_fil_rev_8_21_14_0_20_39_34]